MTTEIRSLVMLLKEHLLLNDGELVYWGERLSPSVIPAEAGIQNESGLSGSQQKPGRPHFKESLQTLRDHTIGDCQLCPLGSTRIKLVFGVGNPEANVMFIGEGPGFDEDRQGEPFVGKAGQLLDKIMASIGLDRTQVYIANIVKCHPMIDPLNPEKRGNDRPPTPEEMESCLPFLKEQIKIINPKIIVTLGATATKALLGRREGISALRGKFFNFQTSDDGPVYQILPTFHPAALLRDEALKRSVWEDMKLLRAKLSTL